LRHFLIAKNASSDKKYRSKRKDKILFISLSKNFRSKRKDKILFISLSNTLMKKKIQKINFFLGYGELILFFGQITLFRHNPP